MRKCALLCGGLGLIGLFVSASAGTADVPALAWKPVSYDLDLRPDYGRGRLFGRCLLKAANASPRPAAEIPLLLYRLLKVTAVRDEAGRSLPFSQAVRSYEDWEAIQADAVRIELPEPAAPGAERTLDIEYEGLLFGYSAEGMSYVKDRIDKEFTILRMDALAYPQIGVPSWKINRAAGLPAFDFRIRVTVPEGLTVANGGRLISRGSRNGASVFVYESLRPSWRIDAAIADYKELEAAADGFKVFCFPRDERGGREVLRGMAEATALFAGRLGAPPAASRFAVIELPEGFGSQADETVILQTRDAFVNPERRVELYHEISHRWSLRALDPLPPRFESEGLAMFLQYWARERLEKLPGALARGAETQRARYLRRIADKEPAGRTAMIDYGSEDLTDLSYSKGMLFFYGLYRLAGEDDFFSALRGARGRFGKDGATARQYIEDLASRLKVPLERYLREWVFEGPPSTELLKGSLSLDRIFDAYRRP